MGEGVLNIRHEALKQLVFERAMDLPSDDIIFAMAAAIAAVSLYNPYAILVAFGILLVPAYRMLRERRKGVCV
jgi:hypothetical protein